MRNCALLVIDMQNFFFMENKKLSETSIVENCIEIIKNAKEKLIPVVHINTVYRDDMVDWPNAWKQGDKSWCSNLVKEKDSSRVVDGIEIKESDFYLEKKRFSAFFNTNLDDILRSLEIKTIYIIGYSADVCIRYTAVDAYNRGYFISIIEDGVESFKESKEKSLDYLEWLIGSRCISKKEFFESL